MNEELFNSITNELHILRELMHLGFSGEESVAIIAELNDESTLSKSLGIRYRIKDLYDKKEQPNCS